MCIGYFTEEGDMEIWAYLLSHNFSMVRPVPFLIDTGADKTAISLKDATNLGVSMSVFDETKEIIGINGPTIAHPIRDVQLVFVEFLSSNGKMMTSMHIEPLDEIDLIPTLPKSILGMDLLARFDVKFSRVFNKVEMKRNDFGGGGHISLLLPE